MTHRIQVMATHINVQRDTIAQQAVLDILYVQQERTRPVVPPVVQHVPMSQHINVPQSQQNTMRHHGPNHNHRGWETDGPALQHVNHLTVIHPVVDCCMIILSIIHQQDDMIHKVLRYGIK